MPTKKNLESLEKNKKTDIIPDEENPNDNITNLQQLNIDDNNETPDVPVKKEGGPLKPRVEQGIPVKKKRQLSQKQLDNLARGRALGREKMKEKREKAKEDAIKVDVLKKKIIKKQIKEELKEPYGEIIKNMPPPSDSESEEEILYVKKKGKPLKPHRRVAQGVPVKRRNKIVIVNDDESVSEEEDVSVKKVPQPISLPRHQQILPPRNLFFA